MFLLLLFYYIFFFHENYFYFFMFRDVPGCSGMFRNTNPECARTTITDKSSWEGLVQLNSSSF